MSTKMVFAIFAIVALAAAANADDGQKAADCSDKPTELWGAKTRVGCDGARWGTGGWAGPVCKGTQASMTVERKDWYQTCCQWIGTPRQCCATTPAGTKEYELVTAAAGCEAKCADGYNLVSCESDPQNSGTGVKINSASSCQSGDPGAKTKATCSKGVSVTVKTHTSATGKGDLKAECGAGTSALWCYCHSKDKNCFETAFKPDGKACAVTLSERNTAANSATVSVLCSGVPDTRVLLIDAQGQANTSAVFCADDMFLLDSADGENTCVEFCPPGFINVKAEAPATGYGHCKVCKGSSSRRRAEVCNKCGPGKAPKAASHECQNMQDQCAGDGCEECIQCFEDTKAELEDCWVSTGTCYDPAKNDCSTSAAQGTAGSAVTLTEQVYACKGPSLGCWYKKMCKSACVCEDWKKVFCDGTYCHGNTCKKDKEACTATTCDSTSAETCPAAFMLLLQGASVPPKERNASFMALHKERMAQEVARKASLDQSLSGKRTC